MKQLFIAVMLVFALSMPHSRIQANSYVLPYPSYLPGSKLYKISRIIDSLSRYWYFGNLGQIRYHKKLSDKYLVEAKVLFDYGQYLLGVDALKRANEEIKQVYPFIENAKNRGINVDIQNDQYINQLKKHCEVLLTIETSVPPVVVWQAENSSSVTLDLQNLIRQAKSDRSCNI